MLAAAPSPPSTRDDHVDLSVVICTYNRAERLERALASIARAHLPEGCTREVLVVDNRSTDRTAEVARAWSDRLPLRYVYEAEQGVAAARNRALAEIRGRLLVFIDDDVEVDVDWLCAMVRAWRRWPTASYLAGRILPVYESARPSWLTETCESLLDGVMIRFSPARGPGPMTPDGPQPMGANLAFDPQALRAVGGFRTDLGRNGGSLLGGEEVWALAELMKAGHYGVYVPEAIVHHYTPARRLRHGFLLRYFTAVGMTAVRMGHVLPASRFGPPRWMLRKLLATGLAYLPTCLIGRPERWIERMRTFCFYLGASCELLRIAARAGLHANRLRPCRTGGRRRRPAPD